MKNDKYLYAMKKRCSRRKYTNRLIEPRDVEQIEDNIASYNKESGLNIKLVTEKGSELFKGFRKSYGLFVGVQNYIAMIGRNDLSNRMEKVGRFGEKLILEATAMGLSTCWVGTSYDQKTAARLCRENETLDCVIAIGYSDKKHSLVEEPVPEWFNQGMDAVYFAPTARNLRPFVFKYKDGQVTAFTTVSTETAMIDLGIAKLHFELGAGGGSWEYGNNGYYYFDDKRKEIRDDDV